MRPFTSETRLNESTRWLASCALIIAMLACGAFTILSLVQAISPDWRPTYLVGLVAFAAFERLFTFQRYERLTLFSREWAVAILTEWVVITLLVRVVVSLSHGASSFLGELRFWQPAFAESFLEMDFLFAFLLVVIAWFVAGNFAGLVEEMGLRQMLIQVEVPELLSEKAPARERLLGLILGVGTVLVMMTALVRVDLRAYFAQTGGDLFIQVPAFSGGGASTLLYFMLGLALLSLTQYSDLQIRWHLLDIPVSGEIARRWTLYSLLFFGLLAGFSVLLPTSYSLGVLNILGYVISIISRTFFLFGQLLITFLLFLLSLPFILFGRSSPFQSTTPVTPEPLLRPGSLQGVPDPNPWLETARSLTLWVALAAILIFSLVQYLQSHEQILEILRSLPGGKLAMDFWKWLKGIFIKTRAGTVRLIQQGLARMRLGTGDLPSGSRLISLGRLTPRQRITFIYLALLRRGDEHGLPRAASQTPREYAGKLEAALPGVEQEIDSVTEAFVEARYSPHVVPPGQASQVNLYWQRIRKALRGKPAVK